MIGTLSRVAAAPLMVLALTVSLQGGVRAEDRGSPVCVANARLTELRRALLSGRITAHALTQAYLARISAYDLDGPKLNAVREVNPDALWIAAQTRRERTRSGAGAMRYSDFDQR